MTFISCPREKEIAELLHAGHWPAASPPELRTHADTCSRCSDLILVTQVFRQSRTVSTELAPLDSPSLLWWRAQLRRRNAALETIARPIQTAQLFSLLIALLAAVGFIVAQARREIEWLSWLSRSLHAETLRSMASTATGLSLTLLIPGLGALALCAAVVLYLAFDRKAEDRK
jgi:hypothetical protein